MPNNPLAILLPRSPVIVDMVVLATLLKGAYISDRVTGKAAAMILSKASIGGIYTDLISEGAIEIFKDHNIDVVYDKRVDHILNRDKSGSCPIESISKDLETEDTVTLISRIESFLKSI